MKSFLRKAAISLIFAPIFFVSPVLASGYSSSAGFELKDYLNFSSFSSANLNFSSVGITSIFRKSFDSDYGVDFGGGLGVKKESGGGYIYSPFSLLASVDKGFRVQRIRFYGKAGLDLSYIKSSMSSNGTFIPNVFYGGGFGADLFRSYSFGMEYTKFAKKTNVGIHSFSRDNFSAFISYKF